MIDWSRYRNFSEDEFRCKGVNCCNHSAAMEPDFLTHLQALRDAYGRPMPVTSGYRCPAHNEHVSRTGSTGPHTTGRAVDIRVAGEDVFTLLRIAILTGMSGIGMKQHGDWEGRLMHLDDLADPNPLRPRVWTYK